MSFLLESIESYSPSTHFFFYQKQKRNIEWFESTFSKRRPTIKLIGWVMTNKMTRRQDNAPFSFSLLVKTLVFSPHFQSIKWETKDTTTWAQIPLKWMIVDLNVLGRWGKVRCLNSDEAHIQTLRKNKYSNY